MTMKIKIVEAISTNLGMNSSAKKLFDVLNNSSEQDIHIDFTGAIFMSRSFTQEYLFQKMNSKKHIVEENLPLDISKMFSVVAKDFE